MRPLLLFRWIRCLPTRVGTSSVGRYHPQFGFLELAIIACSGGRESLWPATPVSLHSTPGSFLFVQASDDTSSAMSW